MDGATGRARAGNHLRTFRVSMRIGLREAAAASGVTATVFGHWERGLSPFDFDSVSRVLVETASEMRKVRADKEE